MIRPSASQTSSLQRPDSQGQARKIPPGPRVRLSGDVGDAPQDALQFFLNLTRQYGDLVRYESPYGVTYLVNRPDYIERVLHHNNYQRAKNYPFKIVLGEGLLSSEGRGWLRQRRLVQPDFHQHRVVAFGPLITSATTVMLERWQAFADRGQSPNVPSEMVELALDVVVKAFFNDNLNSEKATVIREASAVLIDDLGDFVNTVFTVPVSFSPARNRAFRTLLQRVDTIVYDTINERRQNQDRNEQTHDLLSLLLSARNEMGQGFSDRQLRDEVVTMLFAGSESVALMLSWAWYLLAKHPAVERRLHAELDRALNGRLPTVEDLPNLPYTRMVLEESMRLYPPVWALYRQAMADDEIDSYHIEANAAMVVSAYSMHRHPSYWENPDQFDPGRFGPDLADGRPRYAYFPFGGGRHLCLGNHFAMMEGQLVLATVAQRYRLHVVPSHPVEPLPAVTLRQRHGLPMILEARP